MSSTEMKSYLSLIPISAKVRRRQNRMTILCIVLAVFLVTAVFSMADMAIRMETSNQLNKNGNWHIMVKDISPETAAELAAQEDVAAFSAYSDINASLTENYFAGDKRAALVGADDAILQIFPGMQCSTAPADGEVLVTANIRDWLDVTVGTAIPLTLPDGQTISLTVAGFNEDTSDANQYDAVVLVMNRSTFSQIAAQVEESFETQYFIQFKPRTNLRQSIVNIENKYGISEEKNLRKYLPDGVERKQQQRLYCRFICGSGCVGWHGRPCRNFYDHRQHQQQCSAAYQLLWNAALSWGRKKSGSDACPAGSSFLV